MPRQHDDGVKTVLKQTRQLGAATTSRGSCSQQPACAEFICRKLFRYFVSETQAPSDALIAPLAQAFRESHYQIEVPVAMILRSNLFFDPSVRRRRVKSPVEFAVGTIRALEILNPTVQTAALAEACGRMGQSLYAPPSVAGWDGGPALDQLDRDARPSQSGARLALRSERGTRAAVQPLGAGCPAWVRPPRVARRFFHRSAGRRAPSSPRPGSRSRRPPRTTSSTDRCRAREVVRLILTSPEYQLA